MTGMFPRWLVIALIGLVAVGAEAATSTLGVSAVVLSKNKCTFDTSSALLAFGTITPGIDTVDRIPAVPATLSFSCKGKDDPGTYAITHDLGQNPSAGGARMYRTGSGAPGDYLPYSITLSTTSGTAGTKPPQTLTLSITGRVRVTDFQDAAVGSYTDQVVITIAP